MPKLYVMKRRYFCAGKAWGVFSKNYEGFQLIEGFETKAQALAYIEKFSNIR